MVCAYNKMYLVSKNLEEGFDKGRVWRRPSFSQWIRHSFIGRWHQCPSTDVIDQSHVVLVKLVQEFDWIEDSLIGGEILIIRVNTFFREIREPLTHLCKFDFYINKICRKLRNYVSYVGADWRWGKSWPAAAPPERLVPWPWPPHLAAPRAARWRRRWARSKTPAATFRTEFLNLSSHECNFECANAQFAMILTSELLCGPAF